MTSLETNRHVKFMAIPPEDCGPGTTCEGFSLEGAFYLKDQEHGAETLEDEYFEISYLLHIGEPLRRYKYNLSFGF